MEKLRPTPWAWNQSRDSKARRFPAGDAAIRDRYEIHKGQFLTYNALVATIGTVWGLDRAETPMSLALQALLEHGSGRHMITLLYSGLLEPCILTLWVLLDKWDHTTGQELTDTQWNQTMEQIEPGPAPERIKTRRQSWSAKRRGTPTKTEARKGLQRAVEIVAELSRKRQEGGCPKETVMNSEVSISSGEEHSDDELPKITPYTADECF
ncbi:hypothetical protein NDU88_003647 [Pleurodeles waltl]|uniref:Uncharacterized protein n=1 Tax=Pleurodeles waltl TaxID=8319 RepID=A0AAV7TQ74_PLEWA|nr:hypothetical protein NDU88_003647 [Pleurodeles waltl]